jgi:hypothetical protein
MFGIGAGSDKVSAASFKQNINQTEVGTIQKSINNVVGQSEKLAPMIDKKYIKALVQQESSSGQNESNRKNDQGEYGWLVGFTKDTFAGIQKQAETQEKYKNILKQLNFDTPDNAMKSALAYSNFLLRDHTKEQETGKREYKNLTAAQLYKKYNGGGSVAGVKQFEALFNDIQPESRDLAELTKSQ